MSARAQDLTGRRFGRLTVLRRAEGAPGIARWICRCDCGNESRSRADRLREGRAQSCGCRRADFMPAFSRASVKHGETSATGKSPEYHAWQAMQERCRPDHASHSCYFDRGIRVCARWQASFVDFLADVGRRPAAGYSLDRIDNDRGYEPGNVRWATAAQQARNTRRNVWVEHEGKRMVLADLAKLTGIKAQVLGDRLRRGVPVEKLAEVPAKRRGLLG